ncbi:MAG: Heat shock protein [Deltaproteobacteria bacterium]|nr:Heat shock protein [Deltaproteobacteria bacterium]
MEGTHMKAGIALVLLIALFLPLQLLGMEQGTIRRGAALLGDLPGSFVGDLPCADCEGIRYALNLFQDKSYFLSTTYLGKGDDATSYDIGSWTLSSDRRILVLKGGREAPLMFGIKEASALRMLDLEGREIKSSLNYDLKRSARFERIEPRLAMRGMYRYMADAGRFAECLTGQSWPVAKERENATLERAYTSARAQPGEELMVSIEGRVAMRPRMEGGGVQPTLVVERFTGVWPGETCGVRFSMAPLESTRWKLARLGDKPVIVRDGQRGPELILQPEHRRVAGSGSCNRISGSYTLTNDQIKFGKLATTRMACADGMETEKEFLASLERVRKWNILGQYLQLYDEEGRFLARFETHQ